MRILTTFLMENRQTGSEAPKTKDGIRARLIALCGAAAVLSAGCSAQEATPVSASDIRAPENVRTAELEKIRTELRDCVQEAIEVSTNPDGSVDQGFLTDMENVCKDIAGNQIRTASARARTAAARADMDELTEQIIASLNLERPQ
ncbi:MAG: hypothetical protein AAF292_11065 [Pseudomonadota bacterium]